MQNSIFEQAKAAEWEADYMKQAALAKKQPVSWNSLEKW